MSGLTSIVIPAWCWDKHPLRHAREVIDNVRATTTGDYELIMVYAGVKPGKLDVDQLIRVDPPQGWAAATNIGLLYSSGTHLVVGSVDIRVPEVWLPALVEAAGTDTVASPYDFKADGVTRRKWDRTMRGSFWGGWFCFHRQILNKVGYFDGYGMRAMADMDWAIRVRKAGFNTVRVNVAAQHVEPHHTLKVHPDPYHKVVQSEFRNRHGYDRFGSWEGLPE